MVMKLSKLFGMDIYSDKAEYKGKIFDIVINLEKGRLETITTEALRAKSKQEAKKIISEKSIPYKNVKAVKDMVLVSSKNVPAEEEKAQPSTYRSRIRR